MKPSESQAFKQIEGWLSDEEADALFNAVAQVPNDGCIVEIGAYKGRSTFAMALACAGRPVTIFTVDPFTGSPGEERFFPGGFKTDFERNLSSLLKRGTVLPLCMSSGGASMIDIHPHLVFVDGSHVYEDALFDMATWWLKLQPRGQMAIHDSTGTHPGVREALLRFLEHEKEQVRMVTGSISWVRK